jgi:hypothetical protein
MPPARRRLRALARAQMAKCCAPLRQIALWKKVNNCNTPGPRANTHDQVKKIEQILWNPAMPPSAAYGAARQYRCPLMRLISRPPHPPPEKTWKYPCIPPAPLTHV